MNKFLFLCLGISLFINCQSKPIENFSEQALNDILIQTNGDQISFKNILQKHKGKTVFIDIWASWCKDCRKALPSLQLLQEQHPNTSYVFLSLDRSKNAWKKAIDKYNIKGDHYFMSSGWKGPLGQFLDLDWIPRYMIIDPESKILVYNAIKTTDKNLLNQLK